MNFCVSRLFPVSWTVILSALSCGGSSPKIHSHPAKTLSEESTEIPSAPDENEDTNLTANCEARANSLSGKCFKNASEACQALKCPPPRVCTYGYSMPVVVSCGDPS